MIFASQSLPGLVLIKPEPLSDQRGHFARIYCQEEFAKHNIRFSAVQKSLSFNKSKGTLRGLHYQLPPASETKLVRCIRGAVFDVQVDLRQGSPGFGRWQAVELSAENSFSILIPPGFAHGFISLADNTELEYEMDQAFRPESAGRLHWNTPELAISWPLEPAVISEKDHNASSELRAITDYRETSP